MEFFHEGVKFRLEDDDCVLHAAFIGHEKHMLDHVELSLPVVAVVSSFGKYLQYKVETPDSIISAACHNEEISLSLMSQSLKETNEILFLTK